MQYGFRKNNYIRSWLCS